MRRLRFLFSLVFIITFLHSPSFAQLEFNKVQLHFCQYSGVYFNIDISLSAEDLKSIGIILHPSRNEGLSNVLKFYASYVCGEYGEGGDVGPFKLFFITVGKVGKVMNLDRVANWLFKVSMGGRILNTPGEGLLNLADNDVLITYPLGGKLYAGFLDIGILEPIRSSIEKQVYYTYGERVPTRIPNLPMWIDSSIKEKFVKECQDLECLALGKGILFIFLPLAIGAILFRKFIAKRRQPE